MVEDLQIQLQHFFPFNLLSVISRFIQRIKPTMGLSPKGWITSQLAVITLYLELWGHALPDTYLIPISTETGIMLTLGDIIKQRGMLKHLTPSINESRGV